ncbi:MAG: Maf family protein [Anaerolineae bacterium]
MNSSDSRTPVVLASASPRRHKLFALLGVPFVVHTANIDETPLPGETPERTVVRLAYTKARGVASQVEGLVVAADTLVVLDGEILGKPVDATDAVTILRRLRGRSHQVLTGSAVLDPDSDKVHTLVVRTDVWMRAYTDEEIAAYVASGDPLDKAGAYAIQYRSFAPVARLDGCPANVMGLPVCRIDKTLRARRLKLRATPVQSCRPAAGVCAIRRLVVPG